MLCVLVSHQWHWSTTKICDIKVYKRCLKTKSEQQLHADVQDEQCLRYMSTHKLLGWKIGSVPPLIFLCTFT